MKLFIKNTRLTGLSVIALCLYLLCSSEAGGDAPYTEKNKRNAENLSHIHRQTSLEGYLNLLRVFDEETEGEDKSKTQTKIKTRAYALRPFFL